MTEQEFITLVKKMRDAQKAYFKNRLNKDLQESKQLEKEVDFNLLKLTNPAPLKPQHTTGKLF